MSKKRTRSGDPHRPAQLHLFQPLLYQVATGWLSPANIAATLRAILKRHKNTHVLLAEAVGIDVDSRRVLLDTGSLTYPMTL